jgi:hypothetical protein
MVKLGMLKIQAIKIVCGSEGGSVAETARRLGISFQAVNKWPDELPSAIENRVLAYLARKHLPTELLAGEPMGHEPEALALVDERDPSRLVVVAIGRERRSLDLGRQARGMGEPK